jgi:hypothetical protein
LGVNPSDLQYPGDGKINSDIGPVDIPYTVVSDLSDIEKLGYHPVMPEGFMERRGDDFEAEEAVEIFNRKNQDPFTRLGFHLFVPDENLYITDAHHHALNAWLALEDELDGDTGLVHVDAHRDYEDPGEVERPYTGEEAVENISDQLEINEFIVPAEDWDIVNETYFWGDGYMDSDIPDPDHSSEIFDLDLDVFIPIKEKRDRLFAKQEIDQQEFDEYVENFYREFASRIMDADVATVATSPGYIHQEEALEHMNGISRYLTAGSS